MPTDRTAVVVGTSTTAEALARALHTGGADTVLVTPGTDTPQARTDSGTPRRSGELGDLAQADVVVLAGGEDPAALRRLVARAARHRAPGSAFAVACLGPALAELRIPEADDLMLVRLPRPDLIRAAELTVSPRTAPQTLDLLDETLRDAGITAHTVTDTAGGHSTAPFLRLLDRAMRLVEEGRADATAVDTAMRLGCGWRSGPLQLAAELGPETVRQALAAVARERGPRWAPASALPAAQLLPTAAPETQEAARGEEDEPGRERVVVVGSGTMACGIAEALVRSGHRTDLLARSAPSAQRARESVEFALEQTLAGDDLTAATGLLATGCEERVLSDAQIVIEAVVEDPAVKSALFARMGEVCPAGTLLATTTSSLSVHALATASGRPEHVVGLHFFNPVRHLGLVELVPARATSRRTAERARQLVEGLGKIPVRCADRRGFLVNALLFPYLDDALEQLWSFGSEPARLDVLAKSVTGLPLGPVRLLETVGADVALAVLDQLCAADGSGVAPSPLLQGAVAAGHLGRKSPGRSVRAFLDRAPSRAAA
ncbi:3-hydroxyacyl-CoA dehydrogenase NAD-binding domain-containing protein [Streptomyces sp. NPDC051684]|uniref:3-hydroxyacyl-CoA dehydrogenase NAD-binding domain-containing protein n=1 Tax=Streptomyces sp. NPDC051684 TaxID=3365670 RepID=UPI00379C56CB